MTLFDAGARTMTRAVGARRREARRDQADRAGPRAHRPSRHRARRWACRCGATPRRSRTPRAAAACATGRPTSRGCRRRCARSRRLLHRYAWDGGPVKIAGTVSEGDEVAGFKVIELPGPRARADRRCGASPTGWRWCSDCFYTLDMWGRNGAAARAARRLQLRHRAGAREHAQARRAGARRRVAGPRQPGDRRRARRSSKRGAPRDAGVDGGPAAAAASGAEQARRARPATTRTPRATCWRCAGR